MTCLHYESCPMVLKTCSTDCEMAIALDLIAEYDAKYGNPPTVEEAKEHIAEGLWMEET